MAKLTSFRLVVVSWFLHSLALLSFVLFVSGLSFTFASAAGFSLLCIFVMSFVRFSLFGSSGAIAFLGGAGASTLWFPVSVALLDWAVGGGPSPLDYHFYLTAIRYIYASKAHSYTLLPAGALIAVDLLGLCSGLLTYRLLSLARQEAAAPSTEKG